MYKYIYGPVPSRRLGRSLGISPIPQSYCNYSCVYCQLGRTRHMTNSRETFFALDDILQELDHYLLGEQDFDVITIVGEGEPTLYLNLEALIDGVKKRTNKPVAVITNGALLSDPSVRRALMQADIVLPSLDAVTEEQFKRINRPHGSIDYSQVISGLKTFSRDYRGGLWIEIMLIEAMNDQLESIEKFKALLDTLTYDRLYINTPVRPPAESDIAEPKFEAVYAAVERLGGIAINQLASEGFYSDIKDDFQAIKSIIKRHPMNQFEIESFLKSRQCRKIASVFSKLEADLELERVIYKTYKTYRYK